jgi:hypothetical protein
LQIKVVSADAIEKERKASAHYPLYQINDKERLTKHRIEERQKVGIEGGLMERFFPKPIPLSDSFGPGIVPLGIKQEHFRKRVNQDILVKEQRAQSEE